MVTGMGPRMLRSESSEALGLDGGKWSQAGLRKEAPEPILKDRHQCENQGTARHPEGCL